MEKYEEILARMENSYKEETGFVPDKYSDTGIKLRLLAGEIFNIGTEFDWYKKQMFPSTATGKYLEYHCQERGITRNKAQRATGQITFSIEYVIEESVYIPSGTVVSTYGENPLRFVITKEGTIKSGTTYVTLPAIAEKGGAIYNVPQRVIKGAITAVPKVYAIINQQEFTGGTDEETDDELRERLMYVYRHHNNGTNIAYYKTLAESVDGVYSAGVMPKNRGLGTVDVFVAKKGAVATNAIVAQVQILLSKAREVNVDVSVMSATSVGANISVALEIEDGYSFNEVKERCTTAINEYVVGLGVGGSFYLSQLGRCIQNVEGVKRYIFDEGATQDIVITPKYFPVVSSLEITEM